MYIIDHPRVDFCVVAADFWSGCYDCYDGRRQHWMRLRVLASGITGQQDATKLSKLLIPHQSGMWHKRVPDRELRKLRSFLRLQHMYNVLDFTV